LIIPHITSVKSLITKLSISLQKSLIGRGR
jgi:hypothetical protein